jgi:hypothetical protein
MFGLPGAEEREQDVTSFGRERLVRNVAKGPKGLMHLFDVHAAACAPGQMTFDRRAVERWQRRIEVRRDQFDKFAADDFI